MRRKCQQYILSGKKFTKLFGMIFVESIPCPCLPGLLSSTSHRMEAVLPQVLSTSFLSPPITNSGRAQFQRLPLANFGKFHDQNVIANEYQTVLIGNKTVLFFCLFFDELEGSTQIFLPPPKLISLCLWG